MTESEILRDINMKIHKLNISDIIRKKAEVFASEGISEKIKAMAIKFESMDELNKIKKKINEIFNFQELEEKIETIKKLSKKDGQSIFTGDNITEYNKLINPIDEIFKGIYHSKDELLAQLEKIQMPYVLKNLGIENGATHFSIKDLILKMLTIIRPNNQGVDERESKAYKVLMKIIDKKLGVNINFEIEKFKGILIDISELFDNDVKLNKLELKLKSTSENFNQENFTKLKENIGKLEILGLIGRLKKAENFNDVMNSFVTVMNEKLDGVTKILEASIMDNETQQI